MDQFPGGGKGVQLTAFLDAAHCSITDRSVHTFGCILDGFGG